MNETEGLLRYIGGKADIIDWHLKYFPPHRTYVSVFLGSGIDIIRKPRGNEIGNDLNGEVLNFWVTLREIPAQLETMVKTTQPSRALLENLTDPTVIRPALTVKEMPNLLRAWRFFTINRQAFSGTGTGKKEKAHWSSSIRSRRGINEAVSSWLSAADRLAPVAERFAPVLLECDDFEPIIERYDDPETFFYVDPPYDLGEGKVNNYYGIPFTTEDQRRLKRRLQGIKGKALVCGYPTPLYKELYEGWKYETMPFKKSAASSETKTEGQETIWMNYSLPQAEDENLQDFFQGT